MADLKRYPNADDIAAARKSGQFKDDPYAQGQKAGVLGTSWPGGATVPTDAVVDVIRSNERSNKYDRAEVTPKSNVIPEFTGDKTFFTVPWNKISDDYMAARLAEKYSPLAQIGYDPAKISLEITTPSFPAEGALTIGGATLKDDPQHGMLVVLSSPNAMIHESIHRGLMILKDNNLIPKDVLNRLPKDDEDTVRYIMAMQMGDPDKADAARTDASIKAGNPYGIIENIDKKQRASGLDFFGKNPDRIDKLKQYGYGAPKGKFLGLPYGGNDQFQKQQAGYDDAKNALGELYAIADKYLKSQSVVRSKTEKKSAQTKDQIKNLRSR